MTRKPRPRPLDDAYHAGPQLPPKTRTNRVISFPIQLSRAVAAAVAAIGVATICSPLHVAAQTASDSSAHPRHAVHTSAASRSAPHGKANGHAKAKHTTAPAASVTIPAPQSAVQAVTNASLLLRAARLEPVPHAVRNPSDVRYTPIAPAAALGGLPGLPTGELSGRPAATGGDSVDLWGVIAVAEGVAVAALVGTLWRTRRRGTARGR